MHKELYYTLFESYLAYGVTVWGKSQLLLYCYYFVIILNIIYNIYVLNIIYILNIIYSGGGGGGGMHVLSIPHKNGQRLMLKNYV